MHAYVRARAQDSVVYHIYPCARNLAQVTQHASAVEDILARAYNALIIKCTSFEVLLPR